MRGEPSPPPSTALGASSRRGLISFLRASPWTGVHGFLALLCAAHRQCHARERPSDSRLLGQKVGPCTHARDLPLQRAARARWIHERATQLADDSRDPGSARMGGADCGRAGERLSRFRLCSPSFALDTALLRSLTCTSASKTGSRHLCVTRALLPASSLTLLLPQAHLPTLPLPPRQPLYKPISPFDSHQQPPWSRLASSPSSTLSRSCPARPRTSSRRRRNSSRRPRRCVRLSRLDEGPARAPKLTLPDALAPRSASSCCATSTRLSTRRPSPRRSRRRSSFSTCRWRSRSGSSGSAPSRTAATSPRAASVSRRRRTPRLSPSCGSRRQVRPLLASSRPGR